MTMEMADPIQAEISSILELFIVSRSIITEYPDRAFDDGDGDGQVEQLRYGVVALRDGDALWGRAHDALGEARDEVSFGRENLEAHLGTEDFVIEELAAIETIVGDPVVAAQVMVLLEPRPVADDPDAIVDAARGALDAIVDEAEEIAREEQGATKRWKVARFAKKTLIVSAGGLAIAADVVSPDPTFLTKAASIAGGSATIVSQAKVPGE